jgi:hypothetical protein
MLAEIDKIKSRISARMRGLEVSDSSSMGLSSADTKEQSSERADSSPGSSADYSYRAVDHSQNLGVESLLFELQSKRREDMQDYGLDGMDMFKNKSASGRHASEHEPSEYMSTRDSLCLTPREGSSAWQRGVDNQLRASRDDASDSPYRLRTVDAPGSGSAGWGYSKAQDAKTKDRRPANSVHPSAVAIALAEKTLSVQGRIEALREYPCNMLLNVRGAYSCATITCATRARIKSICAST